MPVSRWHRDQERAHPSGRWLAEGQASPLAGIPASGHQAHRDPRPDDQV